MAKVSPSKRRAARKKQAATQKKAKLGSGKRFDALVASLKAQGAKDPLGLAASIGRKKLGKKKFDKLSAKGKKKKSKKK